MTQLAFDQAVKKVIAGGYGNGKTRKDRLAGDGFTTTDIQEIQNRVNQILGGGSSTSSAPASSAPAAAASVPSYEQGQPVYAVSSEMADYKNKLTNLENSKPGAYAGTYANDLSNVEKKYLNRPAFSYDFNADPLYQQYKDQYTQQGNLAMRDTMGNAAALSGGYGNSYATTAGSQAYQGYLSQLNNVIPQLYDAAYNRYQGEGTDLQNQISTLQNLDNTEYSRNQDKLNQYNTDRNYLTDQYNNASSTNMNLYNTKVSQFNADRSYGYTKDKDARDYALEQEEFEEQKKKTMS